MKVIQVRELSYVILKLSWGVGVALEKREVGRSVSHPTTLNTSWSQNSGKEKKKKMHKSVPYSPARVKILMTEVLCFFLFFICIFSCSLISVRSDTVLSSFSLFFLVFFLLDLLYFPSLLQCFCFSITQRPYDPPTKRPTSPSAYWQDMSSTPKRQNLTKILTTVTYFMTPVVRYSVWLTVPSEWSGLDTVHWEHQCQPCKDYHCQSINQ